ncbi:heme protein [Candidatus Scalindua japonica]|uniref:Heme protein n=2 Tax=Candidatus Scalindua japonica TaxID=1284222 RepID=A0A286TWS2_9BACT|nr:heme protein [Candidatus Scalindua japonica]
MAIDRLKNAATLEVHVNPDVKKGGLLQFQVDIKNTGAGHYLPTGLTELRQMWLEVSITDSAGSLLFKRGGVDSKGNIDSVATIYHTVFGNEHGEPTVHVWEATHIISDNRVPPKGKKEEQFSLLIPEDIKLPLKIKAVLNYRSAPQYLVNDLLGEKSIELPIINMTELTKELSL